MKYILTLLVLAVSVTGLWAQTGVPGKLAGRYEYRVSPEFTSYVSMITIKKNGHYERQTSTSHGTHKTSGTWQIKGENLWLTPDKKYKQEAYSMLIGNGYLKIGEVGIHEKMN